MSCAEIWIEFTLKNFTVCKPLYKLKMKKIKIFLFFSKKKEINTLLGDIIKHIQPDRSFEKFYSQLQSIVSKILTYLTDFNILFSMVNIF